MEVCLHSNIPLCHNISGNSGSSSDLNNPIENLSRGLLMNDLKICFTESLFIEDFGIPSIDLNPSPRSNVVREYESKDLNKRKPGNSVSETFGNYIEYPALGEHESSVDGLLGGENWHEDHKASKINDYPKSVDKCFSRRMSLHIPLKLVSAVRGGREKQGCVPKKLSVTWATDVYDPIPAVESHVPSSKNRHNRNSGKKYGRNKHKIGEKSSGDSRPKDMKQTRKYERGTTKHKAPHYNIIVRADPAHGRQARWATGSARPAQLLNGPAWPVYHIERPSQPI